MVHQITCKMLEAYGCPLSAIESALVSHPAVLEVAEVAKEDEKGQSKSKAFIVSKVVTSRPNNWQNKFRTTPGKGLLLISTPNGSNLLKNSLRLRIGISDVINYGTD